MDEIERIQRDIRAIIQRIIQRGVPLSSELRQLLQEAVVHSSQRISELRRNQTIPQGAEQLWVLAGGNPQAFRDYLSTFPNSSLNQVAQRPAQLQGIENRLSDQITLPAGEQQAGVPKAPLNSSNVYGFSYDPRSSHLRVRFQGGGLYDYEGVPPSVFKIFQSGAIPARTNGQNQYGRWWVGKRPSLGASFFNMIRDRFPYQRVA